MSNYYLILVLFAIYVVISCLANFQQVEFVCGKRVYRYSWWWALFAVIPLIIMTGYRGYVADTYAYVQSYGWIPDNIGELLPYVDSMKKDKGFTLLSGLIKIVIGNNHEIYFLILGAIQAVCIVAVFRKYSSNYLISLFLFLASSDYISWMYNGIRQFTAVTLIFAATTLMLKKKWIAVTLVILAASTIHGSAIMMLPIVFLVQGKAWNKKTILFTLLCIAVLGFVDQFTNMLDVFLEDTQYTNVVSDWKEFEDNGTNVIRVIVYAVPTALSLIGRKWIISEPNNDIIHLCTNMSIVSTSLYLVSMGTSGIFIGRLPIYASLYGYILLPYLVERIFTKKSASLVSLCMITAYLLFYYYQVHFTWGLA